MDLKSNNKGWEIDLLPINESKKSGDCILLRFGNLHEGKDKQHVFVIDGGFSGTAKTIKDHFRLYYNNYWDDKYHITGVILTHTDQDHISGLVPLLDDDEVVVSNLIVNAPWKTMTRSWFSDGRITANSLKDNLEEVFGKLYALIDSAQTKHHAQIFYGVDSLGELTCDGAKFTILGPNKELYNTCIANCEKTRDPADRVEELNTTQVNSTGREIKYVPGRMSWPKNDATSVINETSIVFLFEYDGIKILFTGDAGRYGLTQAFRYADDNNINLSDVQIIKIPHHGSRHNIHPTFLKRFKSDSRTCYISCSKEEEGEHPSKMLVNLLNEYGFEVYTTSGSTLHRSKNAPDRGWKTVEPQESYPTIEELEQ